jgi:hypothetical protein
MMGRGSLFVPFGETQPWIFFFQRPTSIPLLKTRVAMEIHWYLRRRSCSSRAMRLDLVMLIIDRQVQKMRDTGDREVWREKATKALGGRPVQGDPLRRGAERAGATSQAWQAPQRWHGHAKGSRNKGLDWTKGSEEQTAFWKAISLQTED